MERQPRWKRSAAVQPASSVTAAASPASRVAPAAGRSLNRLLLILVHISLAACQGILAAASAPSAATGTDTGTATGTSRGTDSDGRSDRGEPSTVDGQYWHPGGSKWWLQHLNETSSWTIKADVNGVKGAHVASDSATFACFLLVQDVCHVDIESQHRAGGWYSPSGQDLSSLVSREDVCGHHGRDFPPEFHPARHNSNVWSMQERQGLFLAAKPPQGDGGSGGQAATWFARGVVSPHDSYMGHLVEHVGTMAEVAEALRRSLGSPPPHEFPLADITLMFGTSSHEQVAEFGKEMSKVIFGRKTQIEAGKRRPLHDHACFKEAIFMLNWVFTRASAVALRERVYARADEERETQEPDTRPMPLPYQVSWLWRSGHRRIVNRGEVAGVLMNHFKGIPVALVEYAQGDSFFKMVETMRRTAFLFGMHGGAFGNVFFLPANATVLEVLPYKMFYEQYRTIGHLFGLQYYQWENTKLQNHLTDNGCFQPWMVKLSKMECLLTRQCHECVKSHALTVVDTQELSTILGNISIDVRAWIERNTDDHAKILT